MKTPNNQCFVIAQPWDSSGSILAALTSLVQQMWSQSSDAVSPDELKEAFSTPG